MQDGREGVTDVRIKEVVRIQKEKKVTVRQDKQTRKQPNWVVKKTEIRKLKGKGI